ncbi:mercuric reductase [Chitinophaga nivalis]|uniref:Mercuric reductase n=1 Tax=Chitinophaga nivalis TaxID=2991709 RepID=A0ABT3IHU0_9BACT|nr:mercuric reductase [Chitinophaga nivalis]MCW3466783.1 mercuric reductase [Chitinophaga nivalis]MCW3483526.1 mercuric reductase [Chitinophaga nivalis]
MEKFDAIVIGSGQGGTPLAKKLAGKGRKTAIIEQRYIGGTCINDGCTPTKTMIASAKVAHTVAHSEKWGITTPGFTVDLPFIIARKNDIVLRFRNSAAKGLTQTPGLTVIYGSAAFSGEKIITVTSSDGGEQQLTAPLIFINTGAAPHIPNIPGLEEVPWLTSTTLLDEVTLPQDLIILGGSYIALEMGQLYQRLGSNVTIVETSPQLVSKEDPDVAAVIRNFLEEEGIRIYTGATTTGIQPTTAGIQLNLITGDTHTSITGSHILLATGRTPATAALQLQNTGVTTDERGYIQVNDQLETSVPGIYALGDVKGGPAFTHISYNDHLLLYKNLFENANLSVLDRQVPYCMFTDPQLGRIGITAHTATREGIPVKIACLGMDKVARAIETGTTTGFMKAIVHAHTGQILGAAIIGTEGGEIMSVLQMAMAGGVTATQLRGMIFAHPLYTESLNNLFMTLEK